MVEEKGPVVWESLLKAFRAKYFLTTFREHKEIEFLELVQETMFVAQ